MATPAWFAQLTQKQKSSVLAAKTAEEALSYLASQGVSLPSNVKVEMAGAINVGRNFGLWLKRKLELDKEVTKDTER